MGRSTKHIQGSASVGAVFEESNIEMTKFSKVHHVMTH